MTPWRLWRAVGGQRRLCYIVVNGTASLVSGGGETRYFDERELNCVWYHGKLHYCVFDKVMKRIKMVNDDDNDTIGW